MREIWRWDAGGAVHATSGAEADFSEGGATGEFVGEVLGQSTQCRIGEAHCVGMLQIVAGHGIQMQHRARSVRHFGF